MADGVASVSLTLLLCLGACGTAGSGNGNTGAPPPRGSRTQERPPLADTYAKVRFTNPDATSGGLFVSIEVGPDDANEILNSTVDVWVWTQQGPEKPTAPSAASAHVGSRLWSRLSHGRKWEGRLTMDKPAMHDHLAFFAVVTVQRTPPDPNTTYRFCGVFPTAGGLDDLTKLEPYSDH
jgi:hypothetical protein